MGWQSRQRKIRRALRPLMEMVRKEKLVGTRQIQLVHTAFPAKADDMNKTRSAE